MISAFWQGILLGLVLIVSVGPVFFAVIDASINKGFRTALFFLAGVSLSDIGYILLTNLGAAQLLSKRITEVYFIGGGILCIFGILLLLKKKNEEVHHLEITNATRWKYFARGWLINTTAPGVFLFWAATASFLANEGFLKSEKISFFSGTLLVVSSADLAKAYLAQKLKQYFNAEIILCVNRLSGVGMIIFGIIMIYKGFR